MSAINVLELYNNIKGISLAEKKEDNPPAVLKSIAKEAGKTLADAERHWDETKKYRMEKEGKTEKELTDRDYQYIMGVTKKRLGLKERKRINEYEVQSYIDDLESKDPEVRMDAIKMLGLKGDERAVEAMVPFLTKDNDPQVREEAEIAIKKLVGETGYHKILGSKVIDVDEVTKKASVVKGDYAVPVTDIMRHFKVKPDSVYEMLHAEDARIVNYVSKEIKKLIDKAKANVKIKGISLVETDSSNYAHATAYFDVIMEGNMEEIRKIAGEDKEIFVDWGRKDVDVRDDTAIMLRGKGVKERRSHRYIDESAFKEKEIRIMDDIFDLVQKEGDLSDKTLKRIAEPFGVSLGYVKRLYDRVMDERGGTPPEVYEKRKANEQHDVDVVDDIDIEDIDIEDIDIEDVEKEYAEDKETQVYDDVVKWIQKKGLALSSLDLDMIAEDNEVDREYVDEIFDSVLEDLRAVVREKRDKEKKINEDRVEDLIARLKNKDLDCWARREAVKALGRIGDSRAIEPLKAVLREGGFVFQGDIKGALRKLRVKAEEHKEGKGRGNKILEQEYLVVARGLTEDDAKKLATDRKGSVSVDDQNPDKFMVMVKEAIIRKGLTKGYAERLCKIYEKKGIPVIIKENKAIGQWMLVFSGLPVEDNESLKDKEVFKKIAPVKKKAMEKIFEKFAIFDKKKAEAVMDGKGLLKVFDSKKSAEEFASKVIKNECNVVRV